MADEKTPEQIAAEKQAAADTAAKLERLAALESEHKELIAQRDKAKQKAKEAEEAKLAENQEFKTLAERRQAELDALAKEKAELEAEREGYRARDEARLKVLMEQVPESMRKLVKDNFSLSDRLELAESLAVTKPAAPGTRLPGDPVDGSVKARYEAAVKAGNLMEQIALKREMFEAT